MIQVQKKNEPNSFEKNVRALGKKFLSENSQVLKSSEFRTYWTNCAVDLRNSYEGICAYTASYIEIDSGHAIGTVDHYIPKTVDRELAYEWDNYRFCNPRVNLHKWDYLDVMDPFYIKDGWFVLDFVTFLIHPGEDLPIFLEIAIQATIDRLELNDDERLVQARVNRIQDFAKGEISYDYLLRKYPFIALELKRQGLVHTIRPLP